jgi:hypothetical protein
LALEEYFAQFDSYVTNLFSPQNECEEWLTAKTSDSSYLISNNTAEIHTSYPITELVEFDIIYNGRKESLLPFVFEKSVYEILNNNDPTQVIPAKGASLYFTLADNKIMGLNYSAPNVNTPYKMALKLIVNRLFGNVYTLTNNPSFNEFTFHIRYKTQDTARLLQFRPDLERFMRDSSYRTIPNFLGRRIR